MAILKQSDIVPIPVFIINLKHRTDRKKSIESEFAGKEEFTAQIIEAQECKYGSLGLWRTIINIISDQQYHDNLFIIICEDDHQFTKDYNKANLFAMVKKAITINADLLSGGISWFNNTTQVSEDMFWVEKFTGLQFTVIFRKFFSTILNANFMDFEDADIKLSSLTDHKYVVFPFISTQREFGYSDITSTNSEAGHVQQLFYTSIRNIHDTIAINSYFKKIGNERSVFLNNDTEDFSSLSIPTFAICSSDNAFEKANILKEFEGRKEFDLMIIETNKSKNQALELWENIRRIADTGLQNDEDVLIICTSNHQFTYSYSKELLLKNILNAHALGINYLAGGTNFFEGAIQVTESLFWIRVCHSTIFIVLFKDIFQAIINEPYNDTVNPTALLSEITSNKMLLYPFISTGNDTEKLQPETDCKLEVQFKLSFEEALISLQKLQRYRKMFEIF